jgi:hypothetical protein
MVDKYKLLAECMARLPYTLWIKDETGDDISVNSRDVDLEKFCNAILSGEIKPYFRSLDTMTEEEEEEFNEVIGYKGEDENGWTRCDNIHTMYGIYNIGISKLIIWYQENHFDNGNFIKSGLALEAKENMYKKEQSEIEIQKFDPTTLQPFDKVLVRWSKGRTIWEPQFFSYIEPSSGWVSFVGNSPEGYVADMVIPYNNETKFLANNAGNPPEYYRYWEKTNK